MKSAFCPIYPKKRENREFFQSNRDNLPYKDTYEAREYPRR